MSEIPNVSKRIPLAQLPLGYKGAMTTCGIKKSGKPDLGLVVSDSLASVAVMTTQNQFAAAPIFVTREHAKSGKARAFIVDSGNANAATGKRGLADARSMCAMTAAAIGAKTSDVLVNSTGVIAVPLPMDKIAMGIEAIAGELRHAGLNDFAQGIMTTDKAPKRVARMWKQGNREVRLMAVAKGVGMIHPNMATMIAAIFTDANVSPALLRRALKETVEQSFNCLTVDGDTSTNDMVVAMANGASGASKIEGMSSSAFARLVREMTAASQDLVKAIAADGEGASRVAEITVKGARTRKEAHALANAVGTSSLFKTALHGCDPNWGRIAMAMGNAGIEFDTERVTIRMAGTTLMRRGQDAKFDRAALSRAMKKQLVPVEIEMGMGQASITCWASSLTEEYVHFNSAYTT